jgi:hypothetical protein
MPDLSEIAQQTVNELGSLDIPDISQAFEFTFSDVQMPAISSPDFEIPELSINTPEIKLPELEIEAPEIPQINVPELTIDAPEIELSVPDIEVPELNITAPDFDIPDIEIPELSINTPDIELPELELSVPEIDIPELEISPPDIQDIVVDAIANSGVDWSKYDDLYWKISDVAEDMLYNIRNGSVDTDREGVKEYFYWDYDMSPADIVKALDAAVEAVKISAEAISGITIEGSVKAPEIDASALSAFDAQSIRIDSSLIQPAAVSEVVNNSYTYTSTPDGRNAPESVTELTINANFAVGEEVVAEGVKTIILNEVDKQQGIDIQLKKRGVTT